MTATRYQPVPAPCTREEARALTDSIAGSAVLTFELLGEAYQRRAWDALGYASWEEYCDTEFRSLSLPKNQRQETIAYLRQVGMSTRAIAAATGLHHTTVADRLRSGVGKPTAESAAPITGIDGKQYPASKPVDDGILRRPDARGRMMPVKKTRSVDVRLSSAVTGLVQGIEGIVTLPWADASPDLSRELYDQLFDARSLLTSNVINVLKKGAE